MDKESFLIGRLSSAHIGDDAAVIGETVYSADAFCEGSHFRREWMSAAQIGRKAMLVNISDAVAMNAKALYALVTLSIPPWMGEREIEELVLSMEQTAADYGCEIIGGDTIGGELLCISVSLISRSENPLYRKGLRDGDLLAYTGTIGESARDLNRLMRGETIAADSRFYEPCLRSDFIYRARDCLRVGMDISDGLFCDCNKLLDINDTGIDILKNITDEEGLSGEEYEMLVAFSPDMRERVEKIARTLGLKINVFAQTNSSNSFRFPCRSHHFR